MEDRTNLRTRFVEEQQKRSRLLMAAHEAAMKTRADIESDPSLQYLSQMPPKALHILSRGTAKEYSELEDYILKNKEANLYLSEEDKEFFARMGEEVKELKRLCLAISLEETRRKDR